MSDSDSDPTPRAVSAGAEGTSVVKSEDIQRGKEKAPEKPKRNSPPPEITNPEKAEEKPVEHGAIPKRVATKPDPIKPLVGFVSIPIEGSEFSGRVSPIGGSKKNYVETGVFSPRERRPTQLPGIQSSTTQMQSPPVSPDSKDLRQLCAEFLDYKRSKLNEQKALEQEMKLTFPKMHQLLQALERLSKRVCKIPNTIPVDEANLRNENDRLNYLIITSAGLFKQIDALLTPMKANVRKFTKVTTDSNIGIDERLKKIITAICSKSEPEGQTKTDTKAEYTTSSVDDSTGTIGSRATRFFRRHSDKPGKVSSEFQEFTELHSEILEGIQSPQVESSVETKKQADSAKGEKIPESTATIKESKAEESIISKDSKVVSKTVDFPEGSVGEKVVAVERPEGSVGEKVVAVERPEGSVGEKVVVVERPEGSGGEKVVVVERPKGSGGEKVVAVERPEGSGGEEKSKVKE